MNLHQIVSSAIGAVNPNQTVEIFTSVGNVTAADGTQTPAYATPGQITASIGGTFTASADGTTLTVLSVLSGSLQAGDALAGSDGTNAIPADAVVVQQLSGQEGGTGTYLLSDAPATLSACLVTSKSTVLNVSALAAGVLAAGQTLDDGSGLLIPGTMITAQLSGSIGGPGLYSLSTQQTIAAEEMTTALLLVAQVQALTGGDLRHMDMLNLQGSHRALYVSNDIRGAVRVTLRGGDLVQLPNDSMWLVNQVAEPFFSTAGWQKVIITLQNISPPIAILSGVSSQGQVYVTEDST